MFSWLNNREQNNDGAAVAGDITNGRFYWVTGRQRLVDSRHSRLAQIISFHFVLRSGPDTHALTGRGACSQCHLCQVDVTSTVSVSKVAPVVKLESCHHDCIRRFPFMHLDSTVDPSFNNK